MGIRYCPGCGIELSETARFCGKCGTKIDEPNIEEKTLDIKPDDREPEAVADGEDVEPEYKEEVTPEELPQKKADKKLHRGVWNTIWAVLLSISIFVSLFVLIGVFGVRSMLGSNELKGALENVMTDIVLDEIPVPSFVEDTNGKESSLADSVLRIINENCVGINHLDADDLQEYWDRSVIPAFVAKKVSACIGNIYSGDGNTQITLSEIQKLLEKDSELIEDIFGVEIAAGDISSIASALEEEGISEILSADTLKEKLPAVCYGLQSGVFGWIIAILAVLLLRDLLLLGTVNQNVRRTCGDTGITLMAAGGIWCIAAGCVLVMDMWKTSVLVNVAAMLAQNCWVWAVGVIGCGMLLLLIQAVGKRVAAKKHG